MFYEPNEYTLICIAFLPTFTDTGYENLYGRRSDETVSVSFIDHGGGIALKCSSFNQVNQECF